MKKYFKFSSLALYLLAFLLFFILGSAVSSFLGAGEGQGLASAAIILGYGAMTGFCAFLFSLLMVNLSSDSSLIVKLNIFLFVGLIAALGVIYFKNKERVKERQKEQELIPTQPIVRTDELKVHKTALSEIRQEHTMGLGFFKPSFYEKSTLYFYSYSNLSKPIMEHYKSDSIVFENTEIGGFEIISAPPWLFPAHLKLDYGIFYFSIKRLGKEFVEVIVNEETNQTAFLNKFDGRVILWPEFILNVFDVEFMEGNDDKVYIKPSDHSSLFTTEYSLMSPVSIQGNWLQVDLLDSEMKSRGMGWIKWWEGEFLKIKYNLLSWIGYCDNQVFKFSTQLKTGDQHTL